MPNISFRVWWRSTRQWWRQPSGRWALEILINIFISLVATILVALGTDEFMRLFGWPKSVPLPTAVPALMSISAFALTFAVNLTLLHWKKFGLELALLKKLRGNLLPVEGTPIAKFAKGEILSTIGELAKTYSGLVTQGIRLPLNKKMQIASVLHDPEFGAASPSVHYWSTALDDPGEMMLNRAFFKKHAMLNCKSKKRLVVISPAEYQKLVRGPRKPTLKKFLDWHEANNFQVRFLLKTVEEFKREAVGHVFQASDDSILTDFALFDDKVVYGASLSRRPASNEEQRVLLLTQDDLLKKQYRALFERSWDDQDALGFTAVYNDVAEEINRDLTHEIVDDYYSSVFTATRGRKFFEELVNKIENAKKRIVAVDVASLKYEDMNIGAWLEDPYLRVVDATAKAPAPDRTRCYVVGGRLHTRHVQTLFSVVFLPQLKDGVKLFLLHKESLTKVNPPPRDFIIIDDEIGFGLGPREPFNPTSLSRRNLIVREELEAFVSWAKGWRELAYPVDKRECYEQLCEVFQAKKGELEYA